MKKPGKETWENRPKKKRATHRNWKNNAKCKEN